MGGDSIIPLIAGNPVPYKVNRQEDKGNIYDFPALPRTPYVSDSDKPIVVDCSPNSGDKKVPAAPSAVSQDNAISIVFSELMDHEKAYSAVVAEPPIVWTAEWDENVLNLVPIQPLQPVDYKISISTEATDLGSNPLTERVSWSFSGSDNPLPVELSSFTALSGDGGVVLAWTTRSETDNLGFNIWRKEEAGKVGAFKKINQAMIPSGVKEKDGARRYSFADEIVEYGKTYSYFIEQVDLDGATAKSEIIAITAEISTVKLESRLLPEMTRLLQNFPNPFNPETWIPYEISEDSLVSLNIYDATGRVVRSIDIGYKQAGYYNTRDRAIHWDGRNQSGESVASGIYFYQFQAGSFSQMRKMILLK